MKNLGKEFINDCGNLMNVRQIKQGYNEKCSKNPLKICLLQWKQNI